MAYLKTGRRVSVRREARLTLQGALERAECRPTAEAANATLQAGIATALRWLDGTHEKLAQPVSTEEGGSSEGV